MFYNAFLIIFRAFATNKKIQRRTAVVKHKIDTGETRPIKQARRSLPLAKRNEILKVFLRRFLSADFWEKLCE